MVQLDAITDKHGKVVTRRSELTREVARQYREDTPYSVGEPQKGDDNEKVYPWEERTAPDKVHMHTPVERDMRAGQLIPVFYDECRKGIASNRAPGPDELQGELLKHMPNEMHELIKKAFFAVLAGRQDSEHVESESHMDVA